MPVTSRTRSIRALSAGTAVAAGLSWLVAVPAGAATYGPADPDSCVQDLAAVSTGAVFGAGECGKGVAVSERRSPGASWRITGAFWPAGYQVEDVAADGAATYVVMSRPDAALGKQFVIGKLVHGSSRLSALTALGGSAGHREHWW